jgi:putative FmdB family regulatory protein
MPKYKYRREDGSTFATRQSIEEPPLEKCPETGQPVERIIGSPSVFYNGEGFHATDYDADNPAA